MDSGHEIVSVARSAHVLTRCNQGLRGQNRENRISHDLKPYLGWQNPADYPFSGSTLALSLPSQRGSLLIHPAKI